jgi:hypothetical protein
MSIEVNALLRAGISLDGEGMRNWPYWKMLQGTLTVLPATQHQAFSEGV